MPSKCCRLSAGSPLVWSICDFFSMPWKMTISIECTRQAANSSDFLSICFFSSIPCDADITGPALARVLIMFMASHFTWQTERYQFLRFFFSLSVALIITNGIILRKKRKKKTRRIYNLHTWISEAKDIHLQMAFTMALEWKRNKIASESPETKFDPNKNRNVR